MKIKVRTQGDIAISSRLKLLSTGSVVFWMTNHPGLPGIEGFPWMWDVLKPGMSQANWNELTTLFSENILP